LEKQMQEQAATLKDLHRRKDEFLAMLSHELRNPLAPIINAVRLLSFQKHEDDLQHQARTVIERQVGQLTRLIDDLLEVSRITTGRIHLQKERIGLNGIVERAVETARPLLDQHHHELLVSLSPQPLWLHADAARIEQVVVNLLTNAAKYTTDGGHISIALNREGDQAVLQVRDTGVGIAPELLPHIFDLFTQADRSLDRSQGGLGIGLSLVQRLVEMHNGKVEVESEVGKGSEFVVRLPVMVTPTSSLPAPKPEAPNQTGPSLRVLVVDDNVDAAQTLRMLLKTTGHDVFTVYDGPTALKAVLDFRPNVVLLDIGLPGLDGFEVAKRLREDQSLNDVVLIAMTGYGQAEDLQRSKEAGFNHHLVKPADFEKVCNILATVSKQAS
jgi:CheY-like chemotaxis protein/two-component sensor histidine kinase